MPEEPGEVPEEEGEQLWLDFDETFDEDEGSDEEEEEGIRERRQKPRSQLLPSNRMTAEEVTRERAKKKLESEWDLLKGVREGKTPKELKGKEIEEKGKEELTETTKDPKEETSGESEESDNELKKEK